MSNSSHSLAFPDKSGRVMRHSPGPSASSGLPVAFSIVSGPATVSSNLVTLTGGGTVTVRASQSGNTNFNAAPDIDRSFVVTKLPQTITFGALSKQVVGDAPLCCRHRQALIAGQLFSAVRPSDLEWEYCDNDRTGLAVIRASQSGDATNAPAPNVDQVLLIVPGNNVITDAQRLANGMFTMRFTATREQTMS